MPATPVPVGRPVPWAPLIMALGAGLVGVGGLLLFGVVDLGGAAVGVLVAALGGALVALSRRQVRLGWANGITLARLVGTAWIGAIAWTWLVSAPSRPGAVAMIGIAVCCLVLDGVDGKVARARGEVSDFGARFDMETDAAMIMILCVAVAAEGSVDWWVLTIGLARYVYWLASLRVGALNTPVAPSILRKIVAVSQSVALLLCLALGTAGVGPTWLPSLIAAIALAGLAWSFVSVTVHQLRTAR